MNPIARLRLAALVPLLAALTLSGCKREAMPSDESTGPASTATIRVAYIPKNSGNPYFDGIVDGMRRGCEELGATFETAAPAQPDAGAQISIVKDQIQRRASVICISPNSPDALNAVFDDARARGIKVITVNSDVPGNEAHRDAAVLPTDFDVLGESQIELLGQFIGYEGQFAILSATTDAPDQNHWIAGMKAALKQPKYAKMQLVTVVYGDDKDLKSVTEAESLLTKYPELRGILAPTAVGLAAAARVVEAAGVYPNGANVSQRVGGKGVVVTGLGTPNAMRRFLKDGIVPAAALWSPPDQGYVAAYLAVGLGRKSIEARPGTSFTVPGIGARAFRQSNVVIAGPPLVFTKDNVDQFRF
jgi:rhamnose transport system substrate-binding protein